MNKKNALIPLTIALCAGFHSAAANDKTEIKSTALEGETSIVFEAKSGAAVAAFEGTLIVPENRSANASRNLTLKYVRFPSTGESNNTPTIYLAGGPGGSGITTAKYDRFPIFMAMREFGDVIAFDQRGTGQSNDLPACKTSQTISTTSPTPDPTYFEVRRFAFRECLDFLREKGIDPNGYTTAESVADLDALRQHLGADKVNLWGISYGSHLSLAALKYMGDHLNKVIFAATEGLHQTIKQPARTELYLDRLQAAINSTSEAKAMFPDIKALIRRVLYRLEQDPLTLSIPTRSGETAPFLLQKRDMQQITGSLISDPARAVIILHMYAALDAGITEPVVALLARAIDPTDETVTFRTMGTLMDVASSSDPDYRTMIKQQAETALLGQHVNDTMHLETVDPSLDLGPGFRRAPTSDVPVLVLSGTLDGRTYPRSHQEATSGLKNRQFVTVTNAGHNLFVLSPEVLEVMQTFMRGGNVDGRNIQVDLPDFTRMPG